jgi:hypothetical protein
MESWMRYFLDTEFMEAGGTSPITLISVGLVSEDGREYYAENLAARKELANLWVRENVFPHLTGPRKPRMVIKQDLLAFIGNPKATGNQPEFWGYFSDYDWVVFCQIFGNMIDLPEGYPQFCLDLKMWMHLLGVARHELPEQKTMEHNALHDARWCKEVYFYLLSRVGH